MAFKIQPSQIAGSAGMVPSVMNLVPEATQDFEKGTPIRIVTGEAEEHPLAATVVDLYGFSLQGTIDPASNLPLATLPTISISKADRNTAFVSKAWETGAVQEDLSAVLIGDQYGLIKDGDDFYVDLDDTTNVLVQITKIQTGPGADGLNVLFWKVLESALQEP